MSNHQQTINEIKNHYSNLPNNSKTVREKSSTINLKKFNNWLKSICIQLYCSNAADFVLDFCSGKGGDQAKWLKQNVGHVLFCDISPNSVKQSLQRYQQLYNQSKQAIFKANFVIVDCFLKNLFQHPKIKPLIPFQFDFVNCQFALHYSWQTESRAHQMLQNVACNLRPNGHFICTIPNAHWIVKKYLSTPGNAFGNSIYQIRFESNDKKRKFKTFGQEYFFTLKDAIDDCPEYLVHPTSFIDIAAKYNLQLVLQQSFHDFYATNVDRSQFNALLNKMNANNISYDEWEAIGIYSVFCFKKTDSHDQPTNRSSIVASSNHHLPNENDIVIIE